MAETHQFFFQEESQVLLGFLILKTISLTSHCPLDFWPCGFGHFSHSAYRSGPTFLHFWGLKDQNWKAPLSTDLYIIETGLVFNLIFAV
jgi:hypothetical protein